MPLGGGVAIGEPFWHEWPLPDGIESHGYVDVATTVERFEAGGLAMTGIVAASGDDWDAYESLHWRAVEEWLLEEPDHPDAAGIRVELDARRREHLVRRRLMGWAVFVGRRI